MKTAQTLEAKSPLLHRMIGASDSAVSYADGSMLVLAKTETHPQSIPVEQIAGLTVDEGLLTSRLTIRTNEGLSVSVDGLAKRETADLVRAVHGDIEERELELAAAREAIDLAARIDAAVGHVEELLGSDEFIRHSRWDEAVAPAPAISARCTERVRRHLDRETRLRLKLVDEVADPERSEARREATNRGFVQRQTALVAGATRDLTSHGLTAEQTRVIATEEDATLVLAGAGTGKTAVIVGKIAHLVRNRGVKPEAILALAFNRKAAEEIKERLPPDLDDTDVATFHSFGSRVISESGTAPRISNMAEDDVAYVRAIDGIVDEIKADPRLSATLFTFLAGAQTRYLAPFDFETRDEYERHVADSELRTLNGELVKSFEELTIANFLCRNGIAYRYEEPYRFATATSAHRQYTPDFFLPDADVYIEHFALDEEGRAPPGWTGYEEDAEWKRNLHAARGTRLIETYSWQRRRAKLLQTLEDELRSKGVKFDPVPVEDLVSSLSQERFSWLGRLLGTFLNHVKSADLSEDEIRRRVRNDGDRERSALFLEIFERTRRRYEDLLAEERAVDFHDLINEAASIIRKGGWRHAYEHVLVDEFQDISDGRMALAEALHRQNLAYFLVGDDWQSIYRFAGSHVELIHDCDRHLGHTRRENLTRTFRFGDGILGPSSAFVQRNPEQTRRGLEAHAQDHDVGVTIVANDDPVRGVNTAFRRIWETEGDAARTVLVLGRFQSSRKAIHPRVAAGPYDAQFSTVHSAKGREADYVIVLDLVDSKYGFPCQVEDDPLLEIVAPPLGERAFPHAEERRLFYVALTRARRGVYLVTDPTDPSPFVRELRELSAEVAQIGEVRPICPSCRRASLVQSQSGDNLRCTRYPRCNHLSPRCSSCREGYVTIDPSRTCAKCSKPSCGSSPRICPECRSGVLVLRTANSRFWGCSRYPQQDSCRFTAPYVETSSGDAADVRARPSNAVSIHLPTGRPRYRSRHESKR